MADRLFILEAHEDSWIPETRHDSYDVPSRDSYDVPSRDSYDVPSRDSYDVPPVTLMMCLLSWPSFLTRS